MLDATTRNTTLDRIEHSQSLGLNEILDVMWRRKWMLFLSITTSLALGVVYYLVVQPTFSVSSRVLVQPEGSLLEGGESQRPEFEFLATQGEIVSSSTVIERAIESLDHPLRLEPDTDPVLAVQENLTVKPVVGTNVLSLDYRSQDSAEGIRLVEAILDSYRQFSQKRSADSRLEALDLLTRSEARLRGELESQEKHYRDFRKQSPLIGQGRSATIFQSTLVEQLGQALTDARNRRIDFQNRMQLLKEATDIQLVANRPINTSTVAVFRVPLDNQRIEQIGSVGSDPSFASIGPSPANENVALDLIGDVQLTGAPDSASIFRELYLAEMRHQDLALSFGRDHPAMVSAREEVAAWKQRLENLNEQAHVVLQREIAAAVSNENRLQELYDQECEKAKANDEFLVVEKQELDAIERLKTMHDSLVVQMNNMRLLQPDDDGVLRANMTVLEAPTIGTGPIWPKASVLMILCGLIGTLFGLGLVFVVERDRWTSTAPSPVETDAWQSSEQSVGAAEIVEH